MELYTGDIHHWLEHLSTKFQQLCNSEDAGDREIAWHTIRIHNFMKYCHLDKQIYCYKNGYLIRFYERGNGYGYFIYLEECENDDSVRRDVFSEVLKCIQTQKDDFSIIRYFPLKYKPWYKELTPIICPDFKVEPGVELYGGWLLKPLNEDGNSDIVGDDLIYDRLKDENSSEVNSLWEYGVKDHIMNWIPLHLKNLPSMAVWSKMKSDPTNYERDKLIGQVFYTHLGVIGALYVDESYRGRGIAAKLMKSIVNESLKSNIIPIVDIETDNIASFSLCSRKLGFDMPCVTFCSMIFHNPSLTLADVFSNSNFIINKHVSSSGPGRFDS